MADGSEQREAAAAAVMRVAFAAAAIMLGLTMPPAHAATTQNVGVAEQAFRNGMCPNPTGTNIVTIKVGDTIRWTNCDPGAHNITWKQPGLTNRTLAGSGQNGDSAQQIFNRSGFYDYYCSIHGTPSSDNMQGRITVEPTQPSTTKATQPAPTTTVATIPPTTTTTAAPATTVDLDGVMNGTTSSSSAPDSTTTTLVDELALDSKDGGASGGLVALLLVGIGAAIAGGIYVIRRLQTEA
ncbi:MAG: plastocyanin/azurin family copper-binding protein [Acidimicrobiales bacterium]|nr:plastocyanin/azurin family copper-binding protein [Acidimicrobiales bacterium]